MAAPKSRPPVLEVPGCGLLGGQYLSGLFVTGGACLGAGAAVERRLERLGTAPADGAAELVRPGGGEGGVVLLAGEEGGDVCLGVGVAPLADDRGALCLLLPGQVLGHLAGVSGVVHVVEVDVGVEVVDSAVGGVSSGPGGGGGGEGQHGDEDLHSVFGMFPL